MSSRVKKALLFYNAHSGNGAFIHSLDLIFEKFQDAGFQVMPVRAMRGLAINKVMEEMDPEEYDQIIIAGGDGTINICVNAMMNNGIDLPVSIFPTGTANDFAQYFSMPYMVEDMIDVALGNHFTYADVGKCNEKYFINVAALGQLVDVSQKTDPNLKNTLGVFSYYLKGLSEIATLKSFPVILTTPEKVYKEKIFFMVVMNGTSAGGFKQVAPESEINDGLLDIVMFREMPILELAPLMIQVLNGTHPKHRKVLYFDAANFKIESDGEVPMDIDGETGEQLPLEFSVLHNRLKIHTPDRTQTDDKKKSAILSRYEDMRYR